MLEVIALYNGKVPEVAQLKEADPYAGNSGSDVKPERLADMQPGNLIAH